MIKAVQDTIAPQLQQMTSIAASQNEFFRTQSEALQMLMQSRPSPKSVPLQNFEGPALSLSDQLLTPSPRVQVLLILIVKVKSPQLLKRNQTRMRE